MSVLGGWRDQYERMLRGYVRLLRLAGGQEAASPDEARDAVFHFFQDAYHLKDWIKNDPHVATDDNPERLFNRDDASRSEVLCLCADLCNGTKHRGLDPTRTSKTGDPATTFIGLRAERFGFPPGPVHHSWLVRSRGAKHDALTVAVGVVDAWEQWLRRQGLLK